jgi:hypothetical protein
MKQQQWAGLPASQVCMGDVIVYWANVLAGAQLSTMQ